MYRLPEPEFDSELVVLLFEIERLRADIGTGSTPRATYIELHRLFDTVMSVVSARIEGNHTTVYEVLATASRPSALSPDDQLREITNIIAGAHFIDSLDPDEPLTHSLIRHLHSITVEGLEREGDLTPGQYREHEVAITGSDHRPPPSATVHAEMTGLLDFANQPYLNHQQMLQIAVAHHRFVWIHPFGNGNGRVSRLFTYAMLRKTIFSSRGYSALNPTTVFGNSRADYISALEGADSLDPEGTIRWTTFFAQGIRDDLDRVVRLQDRDYVMSQLIGPAVGGLVSDGVISRDSGLVLLAVGEKGVVKAADLADVLPGESTHRSRAIRALVDRGLLQRAEVGPRFYQLSLSQGPLAIRLIRQLDELGFLPKMLSDD